MFNELVEPSCFVSHPLALSPFAKWLRYSTHNSVLQYASKSDIQYVLNAGAKVIYIGSKKDVNDVAFAISGGVSVDGKDGRPNHALINRAYVGCGLSF